MPMPEIPLSRLEESEIKNVYIYLADSVRYDHVPDQVSSRGVTFKTVAHALATPQCLPTIVSGKLPQKHGVVWFQDTMRENIPTLFDTDGMNTGYSKLLWHRTLLDVLGSPGEESIESASEPFIVFEHDNGGHAPYPHLEFNNPAEFFHQVESKEEACAKYQTAVEQSAQRFTDRLSMLEERGILDDTLVIYMSDHGELLGEYGGLFGHGLPMTPEVVTVPTVFIHPSLPENQRGDHLIKHTDIYPTINSILTDRERQVDGESLLEPVEKNRTVYSQGILPPPTKYRDTVLDPSYKAEGIWSSEGGHVFVRNPRLIRLATAFYEATSSAYTGAFNSRKNIVRSLQTTLSHYLSNYHQYQNPQITKKDAAEELSNIETEIKKSNKRELSEETQQQLSDLGYR
jgi:arylsulfatase A-like enzyme